MKFKSEPMAHQLRGLKRAWPNNAFGFLWAMGAGKTFSIINLISARWERGQIDAALIVCPTPIKSVWDKEFTKWCPTPVDLFVLESGGNKACQRWMETNSRERGVSVLVVGIEALSQGTAAAIADAFVTRHRGAVLMAIDESSRIKNPSTARTKTCIKIGHKCQYRAIASGTSVTQGIHDLYSQMQFLDPKILNCKSYFLFKNRYCVMGGFENRKIIGYQFEDDLMMKIGPYVDVVTKEEALPDLPPKTYQEVEVALTAKQMVALTDLKEKWEAEQGGKIITVEMVLERMTRYQQVIGGHFPFDDEETGRSGIERIEGGSPKLDAMIDIISDLDPDVKVIIWARFRPEIELIASSLRELYGEDSVREFHGGITAADRSRFTDEFESDGGPRFMVANQVVGGMGQTWVKATVVMYYSNSFSYEDRVQSEDRAHRKGQTRHVHYWDFIAKHPADQMIVKALAKKGDLAKYVESNLRDISRSL